MESLRNVATVAASYVGLSTQNESETETSHIAGGEAPQNTEHSLSNTQSGVEPVSGKLGLGRGGEPYDAGNDQGASALGGSSHHTSHQGGLTSGTTSSSNKHSTSQVGSEPLSQKVEAVFGVGGSSRESHLGGGKSGPGYGQSSKLGSTVAHGTNPDRYLYNSKTAPGLGGHRLDDDFTSSNINHEGADSLPAQKGSDTSAGHSKIGSSGVGNLTSGSSNNTTSGGLTDGRGTTTDNSRSGTSSSSGLASGTAAGIASALGYGQSSGETGRNTTGATGTTGTTGTSRTSGGIGETVARKVDEYTPGTSTTSTSRTGPTTSTTHSGTTGSSGETLARKAEEYIPGATGTRQTGQGYDAGNARGYEGTAPQSTSGLIGERDLTGSGTGTGLAGAGLSGAATSHSRSTGNQPGYDAEPTVHGGSSGFSNNLDDTCIEAREGYKPHGGHPIGEAAHSTDDGKATFLDYRNDTNLPLGRARPADK